jgi:hypothetical protein
MFETGVQNPKVKETKTKNFRTGSKEIAQTEQIYRFFDLPLTRM